MDRMELIDDYTVRLYLKHAFGPIEYAVAGSQLAIVSRDAYLRDPTGFARNPVGTGPYKFVEWRSGDRIILTRNDDYWQRPPAIKDVTFRIMPDVSTAVIALEMGEIDMAVPTEEDRDNLMANQNITYHEIAQFYTMFITMNNKRGMFSDKTMRMAMAHAIDREALIQGALNGNGSVVHTPMPPNLFGWPEDFRWYDYNPTRARELFTQAGHPPDGLTITFLTMASPAFSTPTELIQDQLRRIGINVVIDRLERAAFLDRMLTHKDYEASVMGATAFYPDSDYLFAMYHSDPTEQGRNYHLNEDPVLDRFLTEARLSNDPQERIALYRQVAERFKEEAIQVPLYAPMSDIAANANLRGFVINPLRRINIKYFYWDN